MSPTEEPPKAPERVITLHPNGDITASIGGQDVDAMGLLQEILTSDLEEPDA